MAIEIYFCNTIPFTNSSDSFRHCVKKCPYSELFWSVFSRIRTEYGEIQSVSPYLARMRENADQNNSEYGHFSFPKKLHHKCLTRL